MGYAAPLARRMAVLVAFAMVVAACSFETGDTIELRKSSEAPGIESIDLPAGGTYGAPLVVNVSPGSNGIDAVTVFPTSPEGQIDLVVDTASEGSYVVSYSEDRLLVSNEDGAWWLTELTDGRARSQWIDERGTPGSTTSRMPGEESPTAAEPADSGQSITVRLAARARTQGTSITVPLAQTVRIPVEWSDPEGRHAASSGSAAVTNGYCTNDLTGVRLPAAVFALTCSAQPQVGSSGISVVYQVWVDVGERIADLPQPDLDALDRQCRETLELGPTIFNGIGAASTLLGAAAAYGWPVSAPVSVLIAAAGVLGLVAGYITAPNNSDLVDCRVYAVSDQIFEDLKSVSVPGPTVRGIVTDKRFVLDSPPNVQVEALTPFSGGEFAATRTIPVKFALAPADGDLTSPDVDLPDDDPAEASSDPVELFGEVTAGNIINSESYLAMLVNEVAFVVSPGTDDVSGTGKVSRRVDGGPGGSCRDIYVSPIEFTFSGTFDGPERTTITGSYIWRVVPEEFVQEGTCTRGEDESFGTGNGTFVASWSAMDKTLIGELDIGGGSWDGTTFQAGQLGN